MWWREARKFSIMGFVYSEISTQNRPILHSSPPFACCTLFKFLLHYQSNSLSLSLSLLTTLPPQYDDSPTPGTPGARTTADPRRGSPGMRRSVVPNSPFARPVRKYVSVCVLQSRASCILYCTVIVFPSLFLLFFNLHVLCCTSARYGSPKIRSTRGPNSPSSPATPNSRVLAPSSANRQ